MEISGLVVNSLLLKWKFSEAGGGKNLNLKIRLNSQKIHFNMIFWLSHRLFFIGERERKVHDSADHSKNDEKSLSSIWRRQISLILKSRPEAPGQIVHKKFIVVLQPISLCYQPMIFCVCSHCDPFCPTLIRLLYFDDYLRWLKEPQIDFFSASRMRGR